MRDKRLGEMPSRVQITSGVVGMIEALGSTVEWNHALTLE
jgi:hypothetical protein